MSGMETRGHPVGAPATNRIVLATSVTVYDVDGHKLGYITGFSPSHTRNVTPHRQIGAQTAGRIIEVTPGMESFSLSIDGFVLYNASKTDRYSLINRVGGDAYKTMVVLSQQYEPLTFLETAKHPSTNATYGTDEAATGLLYGGVWITSWSHNMQVNASGNAITGSCKLFVSYVEAIESMPETS